MAELHIGFSGTQQGMTSEQEETFRILLRGLIHIHPDKTIVLHHGDCVGADAQADAIAREIGLLIHLHPPIIDQKRAFCHRSEDMIEPPKPYLERNHDIVTACAGLIATPREPFEVLRSGTWSTIRRARHLNKTVHIITPRGHLQ
jgi:hypothetical protein